MRILWINVHASVIGGCESYILNTVRLLKDQGVDSTFLYEPTASVDPVFLQSFDAAFPLVNLEQQLREIPHDLIYVHQLYSDEAFATLGKTRAPVIRFYHDCWLFCLRRHKTTLIRRRPCERIAGCQCYPLLFSLERTAHFPGAKINTLPRLRAAQRLNQKLDAFVVASRFMEGQVIGNGFDPRRTYRIPAYASEPSLPPHEKEKDLILFAGQIIQGKGLDLLLKAMNHMTHPYRVVVAGTGKQEMEDRALTKRLGLEDRVTFLGKVPQKNLEELYQRAACVVMPIRFPEPFGLVGIEAMRYGTPVVAPHLGGTRDWLEEGKTGLVVPMEDPKAIAAAVDRLWEDADLCASIQQAAIARYRKTYTPGLHIAALMHLFREKIQEKKERFQEPLTVKGSPALEQKLQELLAEIKGAVVSGLPSSHRKALLLIGGYGKGEGGVEMRKGQPYPHNNLDFVFVTEQLSDTALKEARGRIQELLLPIGNKYQIGFDISIVPYKKLFHSSPLLIWHEMYHGHRLLLGDPALIAALPFADFKTVPATEILALMVNRGSLLIINDWLIDQGKEKEPFYQRIIIKHIMKAIIGFGDATLFFLGDYHWSYREKLARIQQHPDISEDFRSLYAEAAAFRFEPHYEEYASRDLKEWMSQVRPLLADLFLKNESIRLQKLDLTWDHYVDDALTASLWEKPDSFRAIGRKVKALLHMPKHGMGSSWRQKLAFDLLLPSRRLAIAFPYIAFQIQQKRFLYEASLFLDASNAELPNLRKAYLRQWTVVGDANFSRSLKEWKLSLTEDPS